MLALWTFTGFDFSPGSRIHPGLEDAPGFRFPADSLPAGVYFRSFSDASLHAAIGHNGFLWGEIRGQGWWYYYFVNALYKVPLGMFLLAVIALGRPRFARVEIGLIIPIAGYVAFCIASTVAIGFRHALPLEILCFIGIGRIMQRAVIVRRAAWVITAITLINIALWHPNYLSFINAPRERVWMQISDSNLDWGQGLKQVRNWIESKRASRDNRSVSLIYFGSPDVLNGYRGLPDELNDDVHIGLPDSMSGWLITTPIAVSRQYADPVLPVGFQSLKPTEMIGDSLLVFDLDDPKVRAAIEESPERE